METELFYSSQRERHRLPGTAGPPSIIVVSAGDFLRKWQRDSALLPRSLDCLHRKGAA